jgi:hypothetical protein
MKRLPPPVERGVPDGILRRPFNPMKRKSSSGYLVPQYLFRHETGASINLSPRRRKMTERPGIASHDCKPTEGTFPAKNGRLVEIFGLNLTPFFLEKEGHTKLEIQKSHSVKRARTPHPTMTYFAASRFAGGGTFSRSPSMPSIRLQIVEFGFRGDTAVTTSPGLKPPTRGEMRSTRTMVPSALTMGSMLGPTHCRG